MDRADTSQALRFGVGLIALLFLLAMLAASLGGPSLGGTSAHADTRTRAGETVFSRSTLCSVQSRARLIVKRRSATTWGVVYRVSGSPPNLKWSIFMENRGKGFYFGSKIASSTGSFRVSTSTKNLRSTDKLSVGSNNSVTGEICRSVARV